LSVSTITSTLDTIKFIKSINALDYNISASQYLGSLAQISEVRSDIFRIDNIYDKTLGYINFNRDVNLNKYQIKSFVVDNVDSLPTPESAQGRLVYFQGKIYWWDGDEWRTVATNENNFDQYIKKSYPTFGLQHQTLVGSDYISHALATLSITDTNNTPQFVIDAEKLNPSWININKKLQFRFLTNGDFEFVSSSNTGKMYVKTELNVSSKVVISNNLEVNQINANNINASQINASTIFVGSRDLSKLIRDRNNIEQSSYYFVCGENWLNPNSSVTVTIYPQSVVVLFVFIQPRNLLSNDSPANYRVDIPTADAPLRNYFYITNTGEGYAYVSWLAIVY
jgi:hypothetical protein